MRQYFKLILLTTMILLLVVACSTKIEETTPIPDSTQSSMPVPVKPDQIILGTKAEDSIRIYHWKLTGPFIEDSSQSSFTSQIKNQFNENLVFLSYPFGYNDESSPFYNGIITEHSSMIPALVYDSKEKYAMPLTDVVTDNRIRQYYPEYLIRDITENDGDIWFLPGSMYFNKYIRLYNQDIFNALDIGIPSDIYELYDMLVKIKNSSNATKIINIRSYSPAGEFLDIFSAFGCISEFNVGQRMKTITYNSSTNSFEDHFSSDEMKEALEYIEAIRDLGVLSFDECRNDLMFAADELVTTTQYFYEGITGDYYTFSLAPLDTVEYISYAPGVLYYIANDTDNPEDILSRFLDIFLGNVEGNLLGQFGRNGVYINYENPEKPYIKNELNSQVGDLGLTGTWIDLNPFIIPRISDSPNEIELKRESYKQFSDWVLAGLDSGNVRTLALWPQIGTKTMREDSLDFMFQNMLFEFLSSDITAEEFIEQYRVKMRNSGGKEYLDKLNEAIGSITQYGY